jgi:hypothetical protein
MLQPDSLKKRGGGASVVDLSMPALRRAGNYTLHGNAKFSSTNGATEILPGPVTCSTDLVQSVQGRLPSIVISRAGRFDCRRHTVNTFLVVRAEMLFA